MKKIALVIAAVMAVLGLVAAPVYATDPACESYQGPKTDANYRALCGGGGEEEAENRVKNLLSMVFMITGIIAVIVIIVGGFYYITSQGDPGKIKKAKDAILYAVIGLAVSVLAYAIVNFVAGKV